MPYTFSPSTLSLLKDCPRCFWLQFNKGIKRPEAIFPSLPSGMDKVLKEHFDRFCKKGILPPELQGLNEVKLFDEEILNVWRNNRKGIQWKDLEGNVLRGAVDNILVKGKKLIVLDFKTRGYPVKEDTHAHYQDQLDIYNFLLRKDGFETEEYAYLLFYHPVEVLENGDIRFHHDLIKINVDVGNAERIFNDALALLKQEFPPEAKECGWCCQKI